MKILPVHENEGLSEFVEFPWALYRDDPMWIPPLREPMLHELSGASAFSRYGRTQLFLCEDAGRVVGRIAALVNPKLAGSDGSVLGQLGYFECIDDTAVASSLITAGIEWLRSAGAREVLAPMNGGAHRSHRFLTRGFDREPFLFEPRNPPYYPKLFEQTGFTAAHRWFSYELTQEQAAQRLAEYDAVLSRRPAPGRLEEVPVDRPQEAISRIHRLLDGCWTGHVGYAPLDAEEFAEVFGGVLSIMIPGNLTVFVQNNRDLGYALSYPDYAAEVRALAGNVAGWGQWLSNSHPIRSVIHTSALLPEVRKQGVSTAQSAAMFRQGLEDGFEEFIVALVVDGFRETIGEQTREYALYSRLAIQ